ncbi:TPA: LLM class flavin-dependent oxidoreductase [Candidatus Bathyarchaeota archaeon]|nr:LLM class flavin-dependent oxidoreductase [Candidatus Bathyarchaeota archaeon]
MRVSWALRSSTIAELLEESRLCELFKLDGIWFPDYQAPFAEWPELYVVLTSLALNTSKLSLGSLITDVLRRHPMVTAHAFATLSQIAPNRLILGLGAGAGTSHFYYGIKLEYLATKLEEGIKAIKSLWVASPGKPAYLEGKHFHLRKAGSPLKPTGKIPIYIASYGPKMIKITAKLANGWIPESHTPNTYKVTLEKISSLMKKFGRENEELEPCLAAIFYPYEPDDEAYKRILNAAKHYLATYPDIQWAAGYGSNHPGLRAHQIILKPKLWDGLANQVPDRLADSTIIYGDIEQCIDRIARFREAGCKHIILEPYWIEKERLNEALEMLGRKIKPKIEAL